MNQCKLCGKQAVLKKSHVVPKFVSNYLKKTSLTGYLRNSSNINKRAQDGIKKELLCGECELRFSKWEREFANEIFLYHNKLLRSGKGLIKIVYDESLISFIISLFWRVTIGTDVVNFINKNNSELIKKLEHTWIEFLNGHGNDWGNCEFHLIFLDNIVEKDILEFPKQINTYLLRLWECNSYETRSALGIYIKLPGMLLLCNIIPTNLSSFVETKIYDHGIIYPEKQKVSEMIGILLLARSQAIEEISLKISPKEWGKIENSCIANLAKLK